MIITKKLLLLGACILGMQYNTYSNYVTVAAYQDSSREAHMSEMLNFAQTLRHLNNKKALSLAQWLETQAVSGQSKFNDQDIAAIMNVVINHRLTTQSKCNILTRLMEQQAVHERKNSFRKAIDVAFATTMFALIFIATVYGIINPAPRIVVQENAFGVSYSPTSGLSVAWLPYLSVLHTYSTLGSQIIVI